MQRLRSEWNTIAQRVVWGVELRLGDYLVLIVVGAVKSNMLRTMCNVDVAVGDSGDLKQNELYLNMVVFQGIL